MQDLDYIRQNFYNPLNAISHIKVDNINVDIKGVFAELGSSLIIMGSEYRF